MRTQSQREMILEHLQAGAQITPMLALQLYGCFALSQRIGELKRLGHDIETVPTRQGRKQFATYRLRGQLPLSLNEKTPGGGRPTEGSPRCLGTTLQAQAQAIPSGVKHLAVSIGRQVFEP